MPNTEPKNRLWQTEFRWAAIVLSGPLLVFALIQVDWSSLPKSSGALELNAEFLVEELVISFKLTLLAIASLSVFSVLCSQTHQTRDMAVLLPFYLWGLEAVRGHRTPCCFSSGWCRSSPSLPSLSCSSPACCTAAHENPRFGARARRIVQIGLRSAISAGVVVTMVLLDLLLLSVVMGESIASEIPS